MVDLIMAGDLGKVSADRSRWSPDLTIREQVDDLFLGFAEEVLKLDPAVATQVPDVKLGEDESGVPWLRLLPLASQSGIMPVERKAGTTGLWIDAIKDAKISFNMPPQVWMELLDGSGWAVEGPGGNAHRRVR